jgi:PPOX class probable F420-dependent enzyme
MLNDHERKLLEGKNFANLATLNADGSPQVSVVWVETDGDLISIDTAVGRLKAKNVQRDPRVAVSVFDQDDPYDSVSINGEVVELVTEGARENIEKLSHKYMGGPYPWHHDAEHRVMLKIKKVIS